MNPMISTSMDPKDDPLSDGPPRPAMRTATAQPSGFPTPSGGPAGNDGGTRALSVMGASPVIVVMNGMMTIEQQVMAISRVRPDIGQLFAPVIEQARNLLAGSLADLASGGTGMPRQDINNPPPGGMQNALPGASPNGLMNQMAAVGGAGGGAPSGGGGMPMMPPPPPQ